ncbi:MAG: DUF4123 domain-containing protein [Algicola sp.]|nr:DUF4123 domain-containing protein [Algicola sp.]
MIDDEKVEQIKRHLLVNPQGNVYAVIDGAQCPELRFKLYDWDSQSCCLWSGKLEPDMEEVAPYMVKLKQDCKFTNWLIREGWDNHWNIFVESELDFKDFRKQIRKLLEVKSPEGETLVFRFYDPRVMAMFVPTCDAEQSEELFEGLVGITYQKEQEMIGSSFSEVNQAVEFKTVV